MTRLSRQHDARIQKARSCGLHSNSVIEGVEFKGNHLTFLLSDGRWIAIHLLVYPKLLDASELQRRNWKLIAGGKEVQWVDIGEDISVTGALALQKVRHPVDTLDI